MSMPLGVRAVPGLEHSPLHAVSTSILGHDVV